MSDKEKVDIYTIPHNFAEEGTILSGRVRTRNACETAVLVFFIFRFILSLDISYMAKIYAGIIVIIPVAILGVLGIQGESLTGFAFHFFCFLKNRRILTVPDGTYRLYRNRRMKKQETIQRKKIGREGGKRDKGRCKRIKEKIRSSQTTGKETSEREKMGKERNQEIKSCENERGKLKT